MNNLSKSTIIINLIVDLSTKTPKFPHVLYDKGFHLDMLEPRFILPQNKQNSSAKEVAPDIEINKNNEYLLFFECKYGSASKDQLDRYKLLTKDDIKRSHTIELASNEFDFDISYIGMTDKEQKLNISLEDSIDRFPLLILGNNSVYFSQNSCKFKMEELNEIFSNLKIPNDFPRSFIPFTVDDNEEIILEDIIQHFTTKTGYDFKPYDLLKELLPSMYNYYSQEGQKSLIGRIKNILDKLIMDEDFKEFITFTNGKYRLDVNEKIKKFHKVCYKFINKYEKNKNQVPLEEFL
ncbi:hypothetical protein Mia14_0456 [Candidatus Mancarchaeum acidiphilum]|uniref:Uncharacterized protein n=2 Tax=Candidatus Mancarchaeum acidiphilum TaxID=1920749 RepID=A0A218NMU2_9ARCH|nr:hypothetical protein Mia14_0456 [Candidatus Mancarchaeum acidiphilum]